jgi:hypothetical protein
MKAKDLVVAATAALLLSACAAPVVWVRPDASPAEYSMDTAQCQLIAEGQNPDAGAPTVNTGKLGRDIAIDIGLGIAHGLEQGAAVGHTFSLCMQGKGYIAMAPGEAAPPPAPMAGPAPSYAPTALVAMPLPAPAPIAAVAPIATAAPAPVEAAAFSWGPCGDDRPCNPSSTSVSVH